MRQEIREAIMSYEHGVEWITDQILSLFRSEISKLKALSDEEINTLIAEEEHRNGVPDEFIRAEFDLDYHKVIAQAQLTKDKEELLKEINK